MESSSQFIAIVRGLIEASIEKLIPFPGCVVDRESFSNGKMLRTHLASKLAGCDTAQVNFDTLVNACAATELVHTASLCHDDVIDNGMMRRGLPALWMTLSPSRAILTGDLFFCEAINLLLRTANGRYVENFLLKIREVCISEIEHEIVLQGEQLNYATCIRIARGKTGPLFAFIGYVCGGDNEALSSALEEAGYFIGTAYQFADDLLDIVGDEHISGKSLHTDEKRGKYTFAQSLEADRTKINAIINDFCTSASLCLEEWPRMQSALEQFVNDNLQCVFNRVGMLM